MVFDESMKERIHVSIILVKKSLYDTVRQILNHVTFAYTIIVIKDIETETLPIDNSYFEVSECLIYLDKNDRKVKLRGFQIELAENETNIMRLKQVKALQQPHFNISRLFKVASDFDVEAFMEALKHLWEIYDSFRAKLGKKDLNWVQYIDEYNGNMVPYNYVNFSCIPSGVEDISINAYVKKMQSNFCLQEETLLHVAYLDFGRKRDGRVFILAHHMNCDGDK